MKNRFKKEDMNVTIPLPIAIGVLQLLAISCFLLYNSTKSKQ